MRLPAGVRSYERLHPAQAAADRANAVRHPSDQLRAGAVHARRADRADHRPAREPDERHRPHHRRRLGDAGGRGRRRGRGERVPRRPGASAGVHRRSRTPVRLRQAPARAVSADAAQLSHLRFRRELLPVDLGRRSCAREDAGLDHPRAVVDADRLRDLYPAGHTKSDPGRVGLRHLDQRADHRRLRHPELSVRDHAAGAVRGRVVLPDLPAARPDLGRHRPQRLLAAVGDVPAALLPRHRRAGLSVAHRAAGAGLHDRGLRRL